MKMLVLSLALVASAASAQTRHNSNAPIDFGADHIELQDKAHRAIFTGSVVARQGDMTLNAMRMTVSYKGGVTSGTSPEAQRVDASGGVTVTRPNQTARGQYGIYDIKRRVVTMLGAVTLTQAGNTVNGARLTINIDTGRAVIDGSSAGSSNTEGGSIQRSSRANGRVTGTFTVPKRD